MKTLDQKFKCCGCNKHKPVKEKVELPSSFCKDKSCSNKCTHIYKSCCDTEVNVDEMISAYENRITELTEKLNVSEKLAVEKTKLNKRMGERDEIRTKLIKEYKIQLERLKNDYSKIWNEMFFMDYFVNYEGCEFTVKNDFWTFKKEPSKLKNQITDLKKSIEIQQKQNTEALVNLKTSDETALMKVTGTIEKTESINSDQQKYINELLAKNKRLAKEVALLKKNSQESNCGRSENHSSDSFSAKFQNDQIKINDLNEKIAELKQKLQHSKSENHELQESLAKARNAQINISALIPSKPKFQENKTNISKKERRFQKRNFNLEKQKSEVIHARLTEENHLLTFTLVTSP